MLWLILFINIAAGIALISNLSPLAQTQAGLSAAQAGTLVFVCSLFNGLGRLFWAAVSDRIGRKPAFLLILGSQVPLFFILPRVSGAFLFCAIASWIFLCYGGGFSVMPAFAAETFGPKNIGSIYGKILLAWGLAGIVGPLNMEFAGSFQRALTISGCVLAAGFVIAALYRKPGAMPQEPLAQPGEASQPPTYLTRQAAGSAK
jgi:OFA family oxalate/formate antiporter-like MFS transporter